MSIRRNNSGLYDRVSAHGRSKAGNTKSVCTFFQEAQSVKQTSFSTNNERGGATSAYKNKQHMRQDKKKQNTQMR